MKRFIGYKGRLISKFSDSLAYYDDNDLFIVTKNFGREGPFGVNVGPLPSFSDQIEITENSIISGKNFIVFNDCEFWDQNILNNIENKNFNKIVDLEYTILSELEKRVDESLIKKILVLLDKGKFDNLSGLGPGLTPLGDDILSGMVLFNKDISNLNIESIFSKHLFNHAINNEVPYPVMKFLQTLNLNFLKKMGSSSGLGYGLGIIKSIKSGGKNAKSIN